MFRRFKCFSFFPPVSGIKHLYCVCEYELKKVCERLVLYTRRSFYWGGLLREGVGNQYAVEKCYTVQDKFELAV